MHPKIRSYASTSQASRRARFNYSSLLEGFQACTSVRKHPDYYWLFCIGSLCFILFKLFCHTEKGFKIRLIRKRKQVAAWFNYQVIITLTKREESLLLRMFQAFYPLTFDQGTATCRAAHILVPRAVWWMWVWNLSSRAQSWTWKQRNSLKTSPSVCSFPPPSNSTARTPCY